MTDLDDSFRTVGHVKHYQKKALSHVMKPLWVQGTIGSLVQFMKDIPDEFILDVNLTSASDAIITLQSSYMREVLLEPLSGLQSDTVEGVIDDPKYSGNVDIHFTSSYDCYLPKWVPVLIS